MIANIIWNQNLHSNNQEAEQHIWAPARKPT